MAPSNKLNLAGQRFGKLTAIKDIGKRYRGLAIWQCRCDCGNEVVVNAHSLKDGKIRSCGCLNREVRSKTAKDRFGFVDGIILSSISSSRKINKNNSTGVRGVTFDRKRNKWVAQITF